MPLPLQCTISGALARHDPPFVVFITVSLSLSLVFQGVLKYGCNFRNICSFHNIHQENKMKQKCLLFVAITPPFLSIWDLGFYLPELWSS